MAKSKSMIILQGTFGGITFVKSGAYGDHIRSKRGTYKKAKLNKALQASAERLAKANVPAKIFQDAIKDYRQGLERGNLWRRLLSMFRAQLRDSGTINFSVLEPFEIHTKYRFDRFLSFQPEITADKKKGVLNVNLSYGHHPTFEKSSFIDGYQLTAVALFPELKKKTARTVAVHSPVMGLKGRAAPLSMQLPIPRKAKNFLVCLRIDGCMKGELNDTPATMGMRMVKAGVISNFS